MNFRALFYYEQAPLRKPEEQDRIKLAVNDRTDSFAEVTALSAREND